MGLETATYISDLVTSNPAANDPESQGDDHLRLIKQVLQTVFPNSTKPFRFPTTDDETASFSVTYPTDQHKSYTIDATAANVVATLPTPTGANSDGFSVSFTRLDDPATTGKTVRITHAAIFGYTANGYFPLQRLGDSVTLVWNNTKSKWFALPHLASFEAGTVMLFRNSTAPVGWTKVTDSAWSQAALRIITTGTVNTGGTENFTAVFTSRTIAQANLPALVIGSGGATANHAHKFTVNTAGDTSTSGGGARVTSITAGSGFTTGNDDTAHAHVVDLGGSGTALNFAVKYVDFIAATKD